MVELEHEAQRAAPAQRCARVSSSAWTGSPCSRVAAAGHALKQADDVEQRALARAGGPDQRDRLAAVDLQ